MPVSTKRFSELRLLISDLLQRGDWAKLFDNLGTGDAELAKAISGIFSMYPPGIVWKFIDFVLKLPREMRRERRESTAVACYILGRIGQYSTEKSISALRTFLADDHMLRSAVSASLGNLWVLDSRRTERALFKHWIEGGEDNDDLQEIAIRSSEYLLSQEPARVATFLRRVQKLDGLRFHVARSAASDLASKYPAKQRQLRKKSKSGKKRHARRIKRRSKRSK